MTAVIEYLFRGYIRTASFKKVSELFDANNVVSIMAQRQIQDDAQIEELPRAKNKAKFVTIRKTNQVSYTVFWDARRCAGSFPVDNIFRLIDGGIIGGVSYPSIGDMVIQHIELLFSSPRIADYLNDLLESKKKPRVFTEATKFYARFTRSPDSMEPELKKIKEIQILNEYEVEKYKFKYTILDLVELKTERAVKYGEKENLSVTDDKKLIRYVLEDSLDWDAWSAISRDNLLQKIRPCAIRCYQKSRKEGWIMLSDEEV